MQGNVSKEMEILRKKQKEMLGIKNTRTEMRTAFTRLISKLDMAEEKISELEDTKTEASKTEQAKIEKTQKTKNIIEHSRTMRQLQKVKYTNILKLQKKSKIKEKKS